eukprot:1020204-Pyramimonas_sp.AAC.1
MRGGGRRDSDRARGPARPTATAPPTTPSTGPARHRPTVAPLPSRFVSFPPPSVVLFSPWG